MPTTSSPQKADFISPDVFLQTLGGYERNDFVRFLISRFTISNVNAALLRYFVGTWNDGRTVFWQIDAARQIHTGKLMSYDASTGKRMKNLSWIHAELKRRGALPADFGLKQCFFGEHLLLLEQKKPLAVVESEKTAIIASLFMPEFLWVATGGGSNLQPERLGRVFHDRRVVLFPDSSKFADWSAKGAKARRDFNVDVRVFDLLERTLTNEQKCEDYDIADFLLADKSQVRLETGNEALMQLLEAATVEQIDSMIIELEERIAVVSEGNTILPETAVTIAEQICLAKWLTVDGTEEQTADKPLLQSSGTATDKSCYVCEKPVANHFDNCPHCGDFPAWF